LLVLFSYRLDWTSVNHLGLATIGEMEVPMSDLVQRGSNFRQVNTVARHLVVRPMDFLVLGASSFRIPLMEEHSNGTAARCLIVCTKYVMVVVATP
jgi:hypothetical protein